MKKGIILAILLFSSGCVSNRFNVQVNPKVKFNPNAQIVIVKMRVDPSNLQDKLEHRLFKLGFDIKAQMYGTKKVSGRAEIDRLRKGKAVYRLKYNYRTYKSFLLGTPSFDEFTAVLTDLRTGKQVFSFRFTGGTSISSVLDELDIRLEKLSGSK